MIRYLVIHHEGVVSNTTLATMKSWPYTKVISKGGRVVNGKNTYHTYGHNPIDGGDALAVCLDGQFEIEKPTDKQIEALLVILKNWHKTYKNARIVGHRDLKNNPPGHNATACPGKNLYKLLPKIREEVMNDYKKKWKQVRKLRNQWRREARLRGATIEHLIQDMEKALDEVKQLKARLKKAQGLRDATVGEMLIEIWNKIKNIRS